MSHSTLLLWIKHKLFDMCFWYFNHVILLSESIVVLWLNNIVMKLILQWIINKFWNISYLISLKYCHLIHLNDITTFYTSLTSNELVKSANIGGLAHHLHLLSLRQGIIETSLSNLINGYFSHVFLDLFCFPVFVWWRSFNL